MIYYDSLWRDAPEGATHWGRGYVFADHGGMGLPALVVAERWLMRFEGALSGTLYEVAGEVGLAWKASEITDLHERPAHWKSAQKLADEYLAEHREELETDVQKFFDSTKDDERLKLDHIMSDACFWRLLLEKHLATERAKIEKETL